jgi:hypothetical protein
MRIHLDSIYIFNTGYRIQEINRIGFHNIALPHHSPFSKTTDFDPAEKWIYSAEDSASWHVFYPPDSLYHHQFGFNSYLHRIKRFVHNEKMDKYCNPFRYGNFLKINIAKLIHLEFAIAYERRIGKKLSWETEAGYQVGVRNADAHYMFNYPLYNYNGFTVLTYPKYYCINSRTYIGLAFLYKYLYFTQVRTGFQDTGGEGGSLQDQFRDDYGLSVRIGMTKRFGNFILDLYGGLGYKYVTIHQVIYGYYLYHDSSQYHAYDTPEIYNETLYMPIVNFGIKIGFGF